MKKILFLLLFGGFSALNCCCVSGSSCCCPSTSCDERCICSDDMDAVIEYVETAEVDNNNEPSTHESFEYIEEEVVNNNDTSDNDDLDGE